MTSKMLASLEAAMQKWLDFNCERDNGVLPEQTWWHNNVAHHMALAAGAVIQAMHESQAEKDKA